jgi:hypothetical protein
MTHRRLFDAVSAIALCCFSGGPPAKATTIVVIRTPVDVSIAADSVGTFGPETRTVCKIHRAQGVFLAIAGIDNDAITKFSVAKVVFESIRFSKTFAGRMSAATSAIESALRFEAAALKDSRPGNFASLIDPEAEGLQIVLFGMENGVPIAIEQSFRIGESSTGVITVTATKSARCPGKDCPTGTYVFALGKHEAIDKFLAAAHPGPQPGTATDAARRFVQLEIDARTKGVGPPIDLLRLSASGLDLIAHKEDCPIDEEPTKPTQKKRKRP